jgi:AcrR family transcriptional regulator
MRSTSQHAVRPVRRNGAREKVLAAAYELFSRNGTRGVGVDTIVQRSGVAKMSLYRHFRSKQDLVTAFMLRREAKWTIEWLRGEVESRPGGAEQQLLAVFDVFDEWFRSKRFDGCSFINVLLEYQPGEKLHTTAAMHLATIRSFLQKLAKDAGLADPERFAAVWHIFMKGSIVAACEGSREAALQAREAAATVLKHWPRAG